MSEKLTLLNPKICRFEMADKCIPVLTREDVLCALARAKDPAISLFGRIYVNHERQWIEDYERATLHKLAAIANERSWKIDSKTYVSHKDILRKLIRVAMVELSAPATCPKCNGKYKWRHDGHDIICSHARGSDILHKTCYRGYFRLSQGAKAWGAGASIRQWRDIWEPRYDAVILPFNRGYLDLLYEKLRAVKT